MFKKNYNQYPSLLCHLANEALGFKRFGNMIESSWSTERKTNPVLIDADSIG